MEQQPIPPLTDETPCALCTKPLHEHRDDERYCPIIASFVAASPSNNPAPSAVADLQAQIIDLERLLKIRETVNLRLLRAAEELIDAPRVVSIVTVHEDQRTLGAALTNGRFFLRQMVRSGWKWCASDPIPGTPAALLRDMYLLGDNDEQLAQVDAAIERLASEQFDVPRKPAA